MAYSTGIPCACCGVRLVHNGGLSCGTCRWGYHYHDEVVIYCGAAPAPKRAPVQRPALPQKPRREWWNR